jgi:hypothetical protein
MSGFHASHSADAVREIACDWEARVTKGIYDGKRAFKVTSAKNAPITALIVEVGRAKNWDEAKELCASLPGRGGWRLPKAIEIVYLSLYDTIRTFDLVPDARFGLLWANAETPQASTEMFRGTSNFISMNILTQTRSTINLDEQLRRHADLLQVLNGADDAAEIQRVQRVLSILLEGIPVYSVAGNLHPYYTAPKPARRPVRCKPTDD